MQRFIPSPFMNDDDLLRSIQVMRDEVVQGVELIVDRILSNAIVNGNKTDLATLHRECELDEVYDTTAWIFDFNKAYTHSAYASIKSKITFFDSHGDLTTINNLADYNPDLHRYKIEIIDFI